MGQAKPLRLWLELSLDERVSGRVVDERGEDHVFAGWLAFFSLIDRLDARARGSEPSRRGPASAPTSGDAEG